MATLALDTKIADTLTVGFALSHRMVKRVYNMLENNNNFILGEDTIEYLKQLRTEYSSLLLAAHYHRVTFRETCSGYKEFFSTSTDLSMGNYNGGLAHCYFGGAIRYGY